MKNAFLLVLALLLTTACSTVPGTGRKRINFMSVNSQLRLGLEAWHEMTDNVKVVSAGADYEMVQRLGRRIAIAAQALYPESPASRFEWEFKLIDDPETANAWALPGGKCAVYSGLLPITGNEDALAAVVGHEVAHALAEHGAERMSQSTIFSAGLLGADVALGDMEPGAKGAAMQALAVGGTIFGVLPYSRKHESEADELGLFMAAYAGYDPREAIGLWERMGAQGGARPPEFLSTHPSEASRIKHLSDLMPAAVQMYETRKAATGRS